MIKIFFITFFIAELIIALTLISKIYKLDKCVNSLNNLVLANQEQVRTLFVDFRLLFEYFNKSINKIKAIIVQKREEYILKAMKTALIYGGFFLLKGKYKKTILAYQVIKEFYEGFQEA